MPLSTPPEIYRRDHHTCIFPINHVLSPLYVCIPKITRKITFYFKINLNLKLAYLQISVQPDSITRLKAYEIQNIANLYLHLLKGETHQNVL
jgi:hypothetical protein